jgi:predicted Zn-dependent protease
VLVLLATLTGGAAFGQQKPAPKPAAPPASSNLLLDVMKQEMKRAMTELGKAENPPYFMSYVVSEHDAAMIFGSQGALYSSARRQTRTLDVSVRVGSPELDNTHNENRFSALTSTLMPIENDRDGIARALWQTTDRQYKQAVRSYLQVKTTTAVRAQEEDTSPDFSREPARKYAGKPAPPLQFERAVWEDKVRRYSALFRQYPDVYRSVVMLVADSATQYFVSSEGTEILTSKPLMRLMVQAETRADDGMDLLRSETFDATSLDRLPGDAEVEAKIHRMAADLKQLRTSKVVDPYTGPALLSGRASAVFFHEVLGHRVEGQRQRGDDEGQTFTRKVNQQVLPEFLSVVSDPTMRELEGTELSGWYEFDEEGVPGKRTEVIQNGTLKEFLMSRMPVKDFATSNGHGRAQPGLMPVARQANLIVSSTKKAPDAELRERLIAEIKKQGKPYGLYFEDIAGGFTLTTRQLPQSFQILPLMVWKVYADGRPDELVRGVDIIGTPLSALNRLVVTGTKTEVFNGQCGAESGAVPVSAAAPAILFSEIEVQKRAQQRTRPPILPPPAFEKGAEVKP